ncbi:hypothetical protein [Streptomyces sp. CRN 30]|uniref:hypothetical protein n=1 Tax=Streptomyces sp. CRN 30 TaxID=3075613 RepID=UPI002A807198|nr:hypothetical protein [Streptomyces sp. CRN 30]
MAQATQPTTTTPDQDTARASYQRARALADRLVGQMPVLPNAIDIHRALDRDAFGVRLHFGTGLDAGRSVLQLATLTDTEVLREDTRDVVWIEARTTVDGVALIGRALTNTEDADQLLPRTATAQDPDTTEEPTATTQPTPTATASPVGIAIPALVPVRALAAMKTAAPETTA